MLVAHETAKSLGKKPMIKKTTVGLTKAMKQLKVLMIELQKAKAKEASVPTVRLDRVSVRHVCTLK